MILKQEYCIDPKYTVFIIMTIRNNTPKASQRRHFINRRLRFATPTVNKVLSLQDKWEDKFKGYYCG
jgi:hypothetical protein